MNEVKKTYKIKILGQYVREKGYTGQTFSELVLNSGIPIKKATLDKNLSGARKLTDGAEKYLPQIFDILELNEQQRKEVLLAVQLDKLPEGLMEQREIFSNLFKLITSPLEELESYSDSIPHTDILSKEDFYDTIKSFTKKGQEIFIHEYSYDPNLYEILKHTNTRITHSISFSPTTSSLTYLRYLYDSISVFRYNNKFCTGYNYVKDSYDKYIGKDRYSQSFVICGDEMVLYGPTYGNGVYIKNEEQTKLFISLFLKNKVSDYLIQFVKYRAGRSVINPIKTIDPYIYTNNDMTFKAEIINHCFHIIGDLYCVKVDNQKIVGCASEYLRYVYYDKK